MVEDTEAYYRRRHEEELKAAEQATDANAANIHRALAARYSVLSGKSQVRSIDGRRPAEDGTPERFSSVG